MGHAYDCLWSQIYAIAVPPCLPLIFKMGQSRAFSLLLLSLLTTATCIAESILRPAPLPSWTQCMEYSFAYAGWQMRDFQLRQDGSTHFNLTNTAIHYDVGCSNNGATAGYVHCETSDPGYNLSTRFKFERTLKDYLTLTIRQTWRCPDLRPDNPYVLPHVLVRNSEKC
jgi:hypothetical protein